jgi:hypothetical protein
MDIFRIVSFIHKIEIGMPDPVALFQEFFGEVGMAAILAEVFAVPLGIFMADRLCVERGRRLIRVADPEPV